MVTVGNYTIHLEYKKQTKASPKLLNCLKHLTWPMAKLFQLLGITYLVGKIDRSIFYFRLPFAIVRTVLFWGFEDKRHMLAKIGKHEELFGLMIG